MFRAIAAVSIILLACPLLAGAAVMPRLERDVLIASDAAPSQTANSSQFSFDPDAERQLIALANRARTRAGVTALQPDEGLARSARTHSESMAVHGQLSHQFPDEVSLTIRMAGYTTLFLDEAAENVAWGPNPDQIHESLMHSTQHRENLLRPSYNVVGIGVVRSGGKLYVTEDFGHSLPRYSAEQAEELVAQNIGKLRGDLPALQRRDGAAARVQACSSGAKGTSHSKNPNDPKGRYFVRYSSMKLDDLPPTAQKVVKDPTLQAFAVGTCFDHPPAYPNGVYWVVVVFY